MAEIKIEILISWLNIVKISVPGYWSNMESFLVYLFNFYYAISELEQNKQNNTIIIFFLLFIFLTKKWTSAVCGGVRAHPSHPPSLRACNIWIVALNEMGNHRLKLSYWTSYWIVIVKRNIFSILRRRHTTRFDPKCDILSRLKQLALLSSTKKWYCFSC